MNLNAQALRKALVGRKIVDTEAHAFRDGRGGITYQPVLVLDNGAKLHFVVHETDGGDYGIDPQIEGGS
jgi:hypothetical protein